MTENDFRKLALSFPEVSESAHMHHPDFRVGGRIFATLGYPDEEWAVVKLTPNEQKEFIRSDREVFKAVKGAWGRQGSTNVYLAAAKTDVVCEALTAAWRNMAEAAVEKSLTQADRFANAFHHLIGNCVGARCAPGEDIVDV